MSYIGNEPIVSATRTITEITATAGQTVFVANGGYTVGFIDVFVNGAQQQTSDFTATNGTSITLNAPAALGDDIRLVAWGRFNVANIASGSLTAGGPLWSQAGGITLPRIDSSNEGGQLNFNRASDDTATWSIDSFGNTSTPSLRFIDGVNVRMTLDGSGNVGIGNTPSGTSATGYRSLELGTTAGTGITAGNGDFYVPVNAYVAGGAWKYATNSTASLLNIQGGLFTWSSAVSGTAGNNISFSERMRIDSSGNLLVGTTSSTARFVVNGTSSAASCDVGVGANGNNAFSFRNVSNTYVGSITVNASSTSFNTSSDYRLKENIAPMTGALAKVAELKPCTYTWKETGEAGQGFIAHELQAVVPDCVTGEKDAVQLVDVKDEEGNVIGQEEKPVYQGVDTSFLVATLTAAIQELKTIVDNQKIELDNAKAEIELLKGAN